MKKILNIILLFAVIHCGYAQTLKLDFPKLGGESAWIYSFTGSKVDSVNITLDKVGKASHVFPQNYRGLAYLYIPNRGGSEFIMAEDIVRITCAEEQFNASMLQFPQSEENAFFRRILQRLNYHSQLQEWLRAGEIFRMPEGEPQTINEMLDVMLKENAITIEQINDSIQNSPLYAARLITLNLYMQRLYAKVQNQQGSANELIDEMQNSLPIHALYHAGNLWLDIHAYYPGLFIRGGNDAEGEKAYASSIIKTITRLEEPVRMDFLLAALTVCERHNLQTAQETMLRLFEAMYPDVAVSDPKVKRMIDALGLSKGTPAPALVGLQTPLSQPAILVFVESDCGSCRTELDYIIRHYEEITAKGYRIISIAADVDEDIYRKIAESFVWNKEDQLCDFKGFAGVNFRNFGIVGTPTIFVINENGLITGRYARISEINL